MVQTMTITQAKTKSRKKTKKKSTKKRVIVPINYFLEDYDYNKRRKEWHKKSANNAGYEFCIACGNEKKKRTVLLENEAHICYFCWITKPTEEVKKNVKQKSKNNSLVVKPNRISLAPKKAIAIEYITGSKWEDIR